MQAFSDFQVVYSQHRYDFGVLDMFFLITPNEILKKWNKAREQNAPDLLLSKNWARIRFFVSCYKAPQRHNKRYIDARLLGAITDVSKTHFALKQLQDSVPRFIGEICRTKDLSSAYGQVLRIHETTKWVHSVACNEQRTYKKKFCKRKALPWTFTTFLTIVLAPFIKRNEIITQ